MRSPGQIMRLKRFLSYIECTNFQQASTKLKSAINC